MARYSPVDSSAFRNGSPRATPPVSACQKIYNQGGNGLATYVGVYLAGSEWDYDSEEDSNVTLTYNWGGNNPAYFVREYQIPHTLSGSEAILDMIHTNLPVSNRPGEKFCRELRFVSYYDEENEYYSNIYRVIFEEELYYPDPAPVPVYRILMSYTPSTNTMEYTYIPEPQQPS